MGGAIQAQAVAAGRRRAEQGAGRRARPRPGAAHRRPGHAATTCFFGATGVTSGDLLRGVRYRAGGAYTQSIVMRSKSGTIRVIDSYHRLEKLRDYSSVDFDLTDEQLAAEPPLLP